MKRIIIVLQFFSAFLTGCTRLNDGLSGTLPDGKTISSACVSRSTVFGTTGTEWEENSIMTVVDLSSENPVEHTFSYNHGSWNRTDDVEFNWPSDGSDLNLTAYLNMEGASANEFIMPSENGIIDQSGEGGTASCDFLSFTGSAQFGNHLSFSFSHLMAKMVLDVTLDKGLDTDYTTKGIVAASFTSPAGFYRSDFSSGWQALPEERTLNADVSPLAGKSQTVTAIVVPGKFDREITLVVEDLTGQCIELTAKASGYVFESGKLYTLPLTVINRDGVLQAVIGDVSVRQWNEDQTVGGPVSENTVEIVTPWDGTVATEYAGGSGTSADPYQIATAPQFALMAKELREMTASTTTCYLLTADIDLNDHPWTAINSSNATTNYYKGTFDGDGHTVSGLKVSGGDGDIYVGLFGYSRGTFKNIVLDAPEISTTYTGSGTTYVSALLAQGTNATIENCHVSGGTLNVSSATGSVNCGSLTGRIIGGDITACSSSATIEFFKGNIGGIAGYFGNGNLTLKACYSAVQIKFTNTSSVGAAGGILGGGTDKATPVVNGCYSISTFEGNIKTAGGISAGSAGTFTACYYTNPSDSGTGCVGSIGETQTAAMNSSMSGSGWQYRPAETGSFPYIIYKPE